MKGDGVLWEPDRTEIELARALVRQRFFDQQVRIAELEEQKAFLAAATQRLAAVALEIDEGLGRAALQEQIKQNEKWWAETVAKEQKQNEAILESYQNQIDCGLLQKMKARANRAKADMERDNARLERLALLKRGVLRGTRKQFAAGHLAY